MEEGQGEAGQQEEPEAGASQEEKPGPSSPATDKSEQGMEQFDQYPVRS